MKGKLLALFILLALSACSIKPDNVVKVESCSDDNGYAWSDYVEITDKNGFNKAFTCQFPSNTTCAQAENAKRIEIVGDGFLHKECKIVK